MIVSNVQINKIIHERNRTYQDGYDEDDDDPDSDYRYDEDDDDYEYSEEITQEDEEQNIESLIRVFLSARNIKSYVESNRGEVVVYIFLNKVEKISNLTKIFEIVLNYLSKDIFQGHECETELYETKDGEHIFSFTFFLDSDGYEMDDYEDLPF
jgi:hypothetical protein